MVQRFVTWTVWLLVITSICLYLTSCGQAGKVETNPSPVANDGGRFRDMGKYSESGYDYLHVICDTKLNRLIYLYSANQGAAISVEPYQC